MSTTYEHLCELSSKGLFKIMLSKGLIPVKYLNDKEMYERFLELINLGENKMDAYFQTSIEFKCSSKTVERVVLKMES